MYNPKMMINGNLENSLSNEVLEVLCPMTNKVIGQIPKGTKEDAHKALVAADNARNSWVKLPAVTRGKYLKELVLILEENKAYLAKVLSLEHGKTYGEALGEVDGSIGFINYSIESARRIEGELINSEITSETGLIERVPYGVTVGILAWNFPLALMARKIGNSLVCGNTMIIKPPTETPLTVMLFGEMVANSSLPKGVLNFVCGSGSEVGSALVSDPITKLVTLTGSTQAGRYLYKQAAQNITVLRLELGGKAPFIIMDDANIDKAVNAAFDSRFENCGQICTCNERMYIHESVYDEFVKKIIEKLKTIKVGDSFDTNVNMGPKVNKAEVEKLNLLMNQSKDQGSSILYDGENEDYVKPLLERYPNGNWYFPKLVEVKNNNDILMHEETFGPILPILKIKDFDEALTYANDCDYGLSAYIFTNNYKNIMRITRELEFGEVYVNRRNGELLNGYHNGFKLSGVGGEDGKHGLQAYLQKKVIYLNYDI